MTTYEERVKNFVSKHNLKLTQEAMNDMREMLSDACESSVNYYEMCRNDS